MNIVHLTVFFIESKLDVKPIVDTNFILRMGNFKKARYAMLATRVRSRLHNLPTVKKV
jgi:hypothetical protein